MIKRIFITVASITLMSMPSGFASASLIDHGDYLTDNGPAGLDWLDVTKTVGVSFNEVQSRQKTDL